ncbi:MAG: bifunctional riboflavin kinase/FAD synthetase [Microcoleaceae cyanobacterium MO_207.B10]|nr:bifunctional riboflavin kinase/FAD synthetase [Microcoleaceae cyanobacterium MO_207.B10]
MWITSDLTKTLTPTTVALGNFDGLHRGHRQVVQPIFNLGSGSNSFSISTLDLAATLEVDEGRKLKLWNQDVKFASQYSQRESQHIYSTVVTFNPHPQEFFSGKPKKLLAPPDEKLVLLQQMGVEQVILLPFDQYLAALTPTEFVEEILVRQLQARRISVGWDFRFGRKRAGEAKDLRAIAANYGIDVTVVPLYTCENGERISSSIIRQALAEGDLKKSNRLLGRPYSLVGQVTKGQQLGRTIGFPTANIKLPPQKFLPCFGVYAVKVYICDHKQPLEIAVNHYPILGVMNIGYRPTVNGGQHPTVEVHLLDWSGDLYGETLTIHLIEFLRPEQKFASLDLLKTQIQEDCLVATRILSKE